MPGTLSPTVRRRRLAFELRRLREAAKLTCEDVAELLECSASKISRVETARVTVSPRDVRDLLRIYGVPIDQQDSLIQLARGFPAEGLVARVRRQRAAALRDIPGNGKRRLADQAREPDPDTCPPADRGLRARGNSCRPDAPFASS